MTIGPGPKAKRPRLIFKSWGKAGEIWGSLGRARVHQTWLPIFPNDWLRIVLLLTNPPNIRKDQGGKLATRDMTPPKVSKSAFPVFCDVESCSTGDELV